MWHNAGTGQESQVERSDFERHWQSELDGSGFFHVLVGIGRRTQGSFLLLGILFESGIDEPDGVHGILKSLASQAFDLQNCGVEANWTPICPPVGGHTLFFVVL